MWAAVRSRLLRSSSSSSLALLDQHCKLGFAGLLRHLSTSAESTGDMSLLDLQEVEKVLSDVKAGDVRVIPAGKHFDWADYMVLATGRSAWHVRNIAQALVYKVARPFFIFFHFHFLRKLLLFSGFCFQLAIILWRLLDDR